MSNIVHGRSNTKLSPSNPPKCPSTDGYITIRRERAKGLLWDVDRCTGKIEGGHVYNISDCMWGLAHHGEGAWRIIWGAI
jgi:hypothetical protein